MRGAWGIAVGGFEQSGSRLEAVGFMLEPQTGKGQKPIAVGAIILLSLSRSSRKVRISWYQPFFGSLFTLPQKKGKRALLGDLVVV